MTPRSGSSLVASIFHAHGVWIGAMEGNNAYGYKHYENVDIRQRINDLMTKPEGDGPRLKQLIPGKNVNHLRDIFETIVPRQTRWCYKTGCDVFEPLLEAYPNARFVFVKRPLDAVVSSLHDKNGDDPGRIERIVACRYAYMDEMAEKHAIPYVETDRVVAGDLQTLELAFAHCDMMLDKNLAKGMVDPRKWRH